MTLLACRRSKERFSFLFFITDILPAASMAGMTSLIPEEVLFQVLREIGLIPQLYEEFLVSDEKIPVQFRCISWHLLVSSTAGYFDKVVLCSSLVQSLLEAPWPKLPVSPRLRAVSFRRLFDILESKRGYLSFANNLVALVRLCGYLLIKTNVIHAFLVNLLSLDEV